jgi:hypothetical protein
MSDEENPPATEELLPRTSPALLASGAIVAVLIALLAVASFILLLLIYNDMTRLEDKLNKLSRSVRGMEEELVLLNEQIPALTSAAKPPSKPLPAAPRATHIDAVDTASDCVIKPGSPNALADCLK